MLLQSVECEVTHLITCEEVTRSDETDDLFILTRYLTRKFGFRFRSASEGFARLLFIHPGDVGFVIEFGGGCYQDTYPMYRACIVHVSCMYLDVSRSYTSRYIEIHRDTSRFICIFTLAIIGNVTYLGICILL